MTEPDKEIEATAFALELLIPLRFLRPMLNEQPFPTALELAKRFEVTETVMTARLARYRG